MFLIVDNYGSFTHIYAQYAATLGLRPIIIPNDDQALCEMATHPDLRFVCLTSGAGLPEKAGKSLAFLQTLAKQNPSIPLLGIGLGALLIAQYAKGTLSRHKPVHGKKIMVHHESTGIFNQLPNPFQAGLYGTYGLETNGKTDLVPLAWSEEHCVAVQHSSLPWTGLLFHPESILTPQGGQIFSRFTSLNEHNGSTSLQAACDSLRLEAPLPLPQIFGAIGKRQDLTAPMAAQVFTRMMEGELTPAQVGGVLLGLQAKGETALEIAMAAKAVLSCAVRPRVPDYDYIDIVGTGGDGKNSFNCSVATGLVLAGMGYKVMKHGNRSVSSKCGSADVLERLGVPLHISPEQVADRLDQKNFVFLFAPDYHPSFKQVMPVRKELGVPTLFNILGPLVNPAMPKYRLIGVSQEKYLPLMAGALAEIGHMRAAVVYGAGGYDELTPMGPAKVIFVRGNTLEPYEVNPQDYGFASCTDEDLSISGPQDGANILRQLLAGQGPRAMSEMLALNVGMSLHLMEDKPLDQCMARAAEAVFSGKAQEVLCA